MSVVKIKDPKVAEVFKSYPASIRKQLMLIRALIFKTAKSTQGVGPIEESLKWGEPAYLTSKTGSGSTIRLAWKEAYPKQYAVYFNCKTSLVESFKTLFAGTFNFEGNRSIVFEKSEKLPLKELGICIEMALTYHLRKK
ncbi:MAG: DUF1801 domain-containing protein [Deltaproteobacteria bacterium]|nr:DUF1801 domain-containing protein [Deltaproteobacteria bacterium]